MWSKYDIFVELDLKFKNLTLSFPPLIKYHLMS